MLPLIPDKGKVVRGSRRLPRVDAAVVGEVPMSVDFLLQHFGEFFFEFAVEIGQILGWNVTSADESAGEVFNDSIDQISFCLSFISIII